MDYESITSFFSNNQGLVIVGVAGAIVLPFLVSGALKLRKSLHVERNGVVGTAVVKRLVETNRVQNSTPEIELELEVTLPGFGQYSIEKRAFVPMIYYPHIQPGMTVEIITDPEKTHDPDYLGLRFHDR